MIYIYDIQTTDFTKNGDATVQPLRCDLKVAINGGWSLELELPYDKDGTYEVTVLGNPLTKVSKVGKWNLIQEGAVIGVNLGCIREHSNTKQLFRVYDYKKTLTSVVAIAYPIAMECNQDVLIENVAMTGTPAQVMARLQTYTNKYTLATNKTDSAKAYSVSHANLGSALAVGFLDAFGGELLYDNFTIRVNQKLGDQNNSSKYPVIYGRNMTGISYERDDSGLATRIYPISNDGIKLNGNGYVNSPNINIYPYIHKRYLEAPYQLVVDKESDNSATAVATRTALSAIKTASMTPSQNITYSLIRGTHPIPFGYINQIKSSNENEKGIVEAVQDMATAEIYHETLKSKVQNAIKEGMNDNNSGAFAVVEHEWTWHEDTSVTPHAWWYGYDSNEYAKGEYVLINKKWEYFNNDGYWEEYKTLTDVDFYQNSDGSWSIGYTKGWYAHNEYVYMTVSGQMKEWWYDSEGWYDADSSGDSDFGWHGDSSSGIWFGEEDATTEDKNKYLHDCWAFIDGTYYFFDQYGFTDADPVHSLVDYPWGVQTDEKTGKEWFGNPDKSVGAKWFYNQWVKLDGDYWYVDSNGYVRDENLSRSAVISQYTTGLASLKTVCNTQRDNLYTLLYQLMTAWCNQQYSDGVDKPKLTLSVNMVDLSKTSEYAGYEALEKICLGDKVDCKDVEHGIYSTERVMGLTYDCIRGYNTAVTIGHTEASLNSVLSTNSGQAVAGGFDTSAMTSAITSQGNAIASLQSGKQDKLTAGQNITIQNNVISATGGGQGLEYWEETSQRFYRDYKVDGISADEGFKKTEWIQEHYSSYTTSEGLLYRKKGTAPVIAGEVGDGTLQSDCRRIVMASRNQDDLDWQWATCSPANEHLVPTSEWHSKESYPLIPAQYPFYEFGWQTATITYNNETWYIMAIQPMYGVGYSHLTNGNLSVKSYGANITGLTCAQLGQFLLEQVHASSKVDAQVSIGVNDNVFQWIVDGEEIAWIKADGTSSFDREDEGLKAIEISKAQYDELTPEQKQDENKIYFVYDD